MAWALLVAALILIAWIVRNDGKAYARFKTLTDTRDRQRAVMRWAVAGFLQWFATPVIGLALLGRTEALWTFPDEFAPVALADTAGQGFETLFYVGWLVLGGVLGALIGVATRRVLKLKRKRTLSRVPDISSILPRNAAEARRVALLTLNAGIAEEVFFRLYLPLLIVMAGGSALLAFAGAALLFGALHRYQGRVGVIATTFLGVIFTLAYLLCLGLVVPMLLHLALNTTNMLVRPALRGWKPATDDVN